MTYLELSPDAEKEKKKRSHAPTTRTQAAMKLISGTCG